MSVNIFQSLMSTITITNVFIICKTISLVSEMNLQLHSGNAADMQREL